MKNPFERGFYQVSFLLYSQKFQAKQSLTLRNSMHGNSMEMIDFENSISSIPRLVFFFFVDQPAIETNINHFFQKEPSSITVKLLDSQLKSTSQNFIIYMISQSKAVKMKINLNAASQLASSLITQSDSVLCGWVARYRFIS